MCPLGLPLRHCNKHWENWLVIIFVRSLQKTKQKNKALIAAMAANGLAPLMSAERHQKKKKKVLRN